MCFLYDMLFSGRLSHLKTVKNDRNQLAIFAINILAKKHFASHIIFSITVGIFFIGMKNLSILRIQQKRSRDATENSPGDLSLFQEIFRSGIYQQQIRFQLNTDFSITNRRAFQCSFFFRTQDATVYLEEKTISYSGNFQ